MARIAVAILPPVQTRVRPASSTAYLVLGVVMLAISVWFFSMGTESIGRRDLPAWALGCVGLFVALACFYVLWKRQKGTPSSLERT